MGTKRKPVIDDYKYEIVWEKFKFPDEDEEILDDESVEDEMPYQDEEPMGRLVNLSEMMAGAGNVNPFFQPKTFNFWTIHCNFKITASVGDFVETFLGVESLDIMSPYRMHISIGKLFDEQEVRLKLTKALMDFLNETKLPSKQRSTGNA
jgi:hypothetical protein